MQVHVVAALLVTVTGFFFGISRMEWAAQCLAIALVIAMEALNTAVEELANKVESKPDPQIKQVKDFAAAGVLFAAFMALIIGCLIYLPKLLAAV